METNETIPIDARVVAFDQTGHYNIEEKHKPFIKAIRGIYLYDKNSNTYLCELTPSYWLIHLYDQVIFNEAGDDLSDSIKDEIYEAYEHCNVEDIYMHCRDVDKEETSGRENYYIYGDPGVKFEDTPRDEQMEAIREHLCGNCPL